MMGSLSEFQKATLKIASTKALKTRHRGPPSKVLRDDYNIPLCHTITPRSWALSSLLLKVTDWVAA